MTGALRLSLGPVPYLWPCAAMFEFYERIAGTPVDIVYLGETTCSKRRELKPEDWRVLAERLATAGKEVVLSTLTLLTARSEIGALRRICNNDRFMVEANDMAAVSALAGKGPFVTGPSVNVYNARTLQFLAKRGLRRWVLPVELSRKTLQEIQADRPQGIETEVFSYGRLPLAFSARCYTARAYNLPKDDCQFKCRDHPDGLMLYTREDAPFLVLNGIQTQSAQTFNLIGEIDELRRLDVDVMRIDPQSEHTDRIIDLFHDALAGAKHAADAARDLEDLMPIGPCNGYWFGGAGMQWQGASLA